MILFICKHNADEIRANLAWQGRACIRPLQPDSPAPGAESSLQPDSPHKISTLCEINQTLCRNEASHTFRIISG